MHNFRFMFRFMFGGTWIDFCLEARVWICVIVGMSGFLSDIEGPLCIYGALYVYMGLFCKYTRHFYGYFSFQLYDSDIDGPLYIYKALLRLYRSFGYCWYQLYDSILNVCIYVYKYRQIHMYTRIYTHIYKYINIFMYM